MLAVSDALLSARALHDVTQRVGRTGHEAQYSSGEFEDAVIRHSSSKPLTASATAEEPYSRVNLAASSRALELLHEQRSPQGAEETLAATYAAALNGELVEREITLDFEVSSRMTRVRGQEQYEEHASKQIAEAESKEREATDE